MEPTNFRSTLRRLAALDYSENTLVLENGNIVTQPRTTRFSFLFSKSSGNASKLMEVVDKLTEIIGSNQLPVKSLSKFSVIDDLSKISSGLIMQVKALNGSSEEIKQVASKLSNLINKIALNIVYDPNFRVNLKHYLNSQSLELCSNEHLAELNNSILELENKLRADVDTFVINDSLFINKKILEVKSDEEIKSMLLELKKNHDFSSIIIEGLASPLSWNELTFILNETKIPLRIFLFPLDSHKNIFLYEGFLYITKRFIKESNDIISSLYKIIYPVSIINPLYDITKPLCDMINPLYSIPTFSSVFIQGFTSSFSYDEFKDFICRIIPLPIKSFLAALSKNKETYVKEGLFIFISRNQIEKMSEEELRDFFKTNMKSRPAIFIQGFNGFWDKFEIYKILHNYTSLKNCLRPHYAVWENPPRKIKINRTMIVHSPLVRAQIIEKEQSLVGSSAENVRACELVFDHIEADEFNILSNFLDSDDKRNYPLLNRSNVNRWFRIYRDFGYNKYFESYCFEVKKAQFEEKEREMLLSILKNECKDFEEIVKDENKLQERIDFIKENHGQHFYNATCSEFQQAKFNFEQEILEFDRIFSAYVVPGIKKYTNHIINKFKKYYDIKNLFSFFPNEDKFEINVVSALILKSKYIEKNEEETIRTTFEEFLRKSIERPEAPKFFIEGFPYAFDVSLVEKILNNPEYSLQKILTPCYLKLCSKDGQREISVRLNPYLIMKSAFLREFFKRSCTLSNCEICEKLNEVFAKIPFEIFELINNLHEPSKFLLKPPSSILGELTLAAKLLSIKSLLKVYSGAEEFA